MVDDWMMSAGSKGGMTCVRTKSGLQKVVTFCYLVTCHHMPLLSKL